MPTVALGAAAFLALHLFFALTWEALFQPAELARAWFMGSRSSLVVAQVVFGLIAFAILVRGERTWRRLFLQAGRLTFGAMLAAIGLFFAIGPAELMIGPVELWPMALSAALFLLLLPILAGAMLALFVGGLLEK